MQRTSVVLLAVLTSACGAPSEPPRTPETAPAESRKPETAPVATEASTAPPEPGPAESAPAVAKTMLTEVEPPPSPATMPVVTVSAPTAGQLIPAAKAADTDVKIAVQGWDVGPGKEHLCVSLDAGPCVRVDEAKRTLKLSELASKLSEGQHVLAVIARHKGGEAVRPRGKSAAFAAVSFFVEKRAKPTWKAGDPLVIMLPPSDPVAAGGDAVVDYYVANAEMADGKYLAQIALAGPGLNTAETSSKGWPFRLKNPQPGSYLLRVALAKYGAELGESSSKTTVKYSSKTMTGAYVDSTRTFRWPASK